MRKISDQVESAPDIFMRRTWLPLLTKVRMQVADIINAQADEVVIVPSATHGVNNIANQLNWRKGDIIVLCKSTPISTFSQIQNRMVVKRRGILIDGRVDSTSYNALAQTMKYICDRHDDVTIEHVDLTFPCPHSEVIAKTEAMLEKYNHATGPRHAFNGHPEGKSHDKRVRMVLVDTIASNPGLVDICVNNECSSVMADWVFEVWRILGKRSLDCVKSTVRSVWSMERIRSVNTL